MQFLKKAMTMDMVTKEVKSEVQILFYEIAIIYIAKRF